MTTERVLSSDARREAVDVGYGNTAGRLQGTVYVFREPNAWPTTKKAPSPDVFAAASVHKSARVSIHQATYIIDLQISIKIEFLDNQGDSKSSL